KMADDTSGIKIKTHTIELDYNVAWGQKLGTGISGPVRPCTCKKTGQRFALKCLLDRSKARTEVRLHVKCSGHPNIVTIYNVYANDVQFPGEAQPKARLLVVMELMDGGELFDRISQQRCFTEKQVASYTRQIAKAVDRCHSLNIAHRDLKPENLLLKDNTEDAVVKLSDFGFAKIDDGNLMTPHFTPYYVAPQVLEAQRQQNKDKYHIIPSAVPYTYDKACDMWSLGVIIYIMLCGYPPFYSETPSKQITNKMKKRIMAGEYEFPTEDWSHVSEHAKSLVKKLLMTDPQHRMVVDDLLRDSWLDGDAPSTPLHSPTIMLDKNLLEEARQQHALQLTNMRLPDPQLTLKPLKNVNNPIIKKRQNSSAIGPQQTQGEPPRKQSSRDVAIQKLRDIIAYLILPPASEDYTEQLNNLIDEALRLYEFEENKDILGTLHDMKNMDFNISIERQTVAHSLSEMVKSLTDPMLDNNKPLQSTSSSHQHRADPTVL
ncbi:unnamed protein product, partial [Owenia fusiformis]